MLLLMSIAQASFTHLAQPSPMTSSLTRGTSEHNSVAVLTAKCHRETYRVVKAKLAMTAGLGLSCKHVQLSVSQKWLVHLSVAAVLVCIPVQCHNRIHTAADDAQASKPYVKSTQTSGVFCIVLFATIS